MSHPRQLTHLFSIYQTLVKYGLDELIPVTRALPILRLFLWLTPAYWQRSAAAPRGQRIREALEELGPIFVKFGQILSTRRDLLPDDIALELAKLQDQVKPIPNAQAWQILHDAYGCAPDVVFAEFDPNPLAAASIAQVHAARLLDGSDVVVKILRPGIEKRIKRDIELMYLLAELTQNYWVDSRRLRLIEVVQEFERHLYDELDLMQEAANCAMLRRNFEESDLLYIPRVEWDYTRRNVMVLERIYGIQISDIEQLKAHKVNLRRLGEIGVEIFFTQVFQDNFFHADMHPGNIFVDAENPDYPHYIAVDFGIMGVLNKADQHYLAENFLAFFNRDYHRVAELHVVSGWVPSNTRVEDFESAIRTVCEPIFNRPLKEISFGLVLMRLFQTARRFNMEVQPQLVLLQKTFLNIEGLGRQLYPELDLWQTAKPFLERWMRERLGLWALWQNVQEAAPQWIETLPQLPILLHSSLEQLSQERRQREQMLVQLKSLEQAVKSNGRQHGVNIGGAALLLSGSLLLSLQNLSVSYTVMAGFALASTGLAILLIAWLSDNR